MLWEVDLYAAPGEPDLEARRVLQDAADLGLAQGFSLVSARGFLLEGELALEDVERAARELLADLVVERFAAHSVGDDALLQPPQPGLQLVQVLPRPGVMDPVAQSTLQALAAWGLPASAVRTLRKYWIGGLTAEQQKTLCSRILANEAIEQVVSGPLPFDRLQLGAPYEFKLVHVPVRELDDAALLHLSRSGQLYLSLAEMQTIQAYYRRLGREPTDAELETLAQTWSEHCSHKTLKGRIEYRDEQCAVTFENMLRETIFEATVQVRAALGAEDWCVSVFEDNAGIVRFDEQHNVVFKVETHNHPSAIEPYGGANTGLGGVIRDPLGTGLGAKPICNTDVFCFAPPETPWDSLPQGVLHPKRVMRGVVAGVRDYGNRMGIPTVNGAICFDPRYLGNPLVYCGNVGLIPRNKSHKQPRPGDLLVALGGRTGRDGIHGATFSSAELTSESESLSGGAVQIGNAITEKMLLDIVLQARDEELFHALTDCGAGGFSSAIGEMGAEIGAEVWLDQAPLKYEGLSYAEIWISEAQERMVLSVPAEKWPRLQALAASEGVEAVAIGRLEPTGSLRLKYGPHVVGELEMSFLHDGRPPVVRKAEYVPPPRKPLQVPDKWRAEYTTELLQILGALNVCSKEWVIRQYDHEVQAGSVVKPLVGARNDGPSDAAVVRPVLGSHRGLAIACGINPAYGDLDPYAMAASAIDEAIRNCVAVGADPDRVAILDNFCWGDCEQPATLGSLVRAALACRDIAVAMRTPFISGKDSLNNEFRYTDAQGERRSIAIPPTLLVSALGQVADVTQCVTMDLKQPGDFLYLVGLTRDELGGSQFALTQGLSGGMPPQLNPAAALKQYQALHRAIRAGLVKACHDLSEGGLAAAAAEMAMAGELGARVMLGQVPHAIELSADDQAEATRQQALLPSHDVPPLSVVPEATAILLFSESNSRLLCEVSPENCAAFEEMMAGTVCGLVGEVLTEPRLEIVGLPAVLPGVEESQPHELRAALVVQASLTEIREAWQKPLRW